MDVKEAVFSRRSYRGSYRPDPVPEEDLRTIMAAGLAAPSGCNKQTTSLIAVNDPELLSRLRKVILPPVGETAPAMICVLTKRIAAYRDRCFAVQDYAAAIENMLLMAVALGYQSCWYEGHITDTDRIGDRMAQILGVPKEYDLVCFLPVGKAAGEPLAPKKKDFSERAFFNGFGTGADGVRQGPGSRAGSRTEASLSLFDNHDFRLPYYELVLERPLGDLRDCPMPGGCRIVSYADGDRDAWIDIEKSAREFASREDGLAAWERYYGGREEDLKGRMFFAENARGEKIATATAWHDIRKEDDGVNAMLHWVAVRRDMQGKGISKPLILYVLRRMAALGYTRVVVPTQTTTWLACKVYLDLGFRPVAQNAENSRPGWEILRALTGHPALGAFGEADVSRYLEKT